MDDALLTRLIDASRALVAIAPASISASPVEVTLPQLRALVVLSGDGPVTMSDVGRATGLSPSSTTRLVERLERKGLVVRRPSALSRRSIDVVLTDAGTEVVDAVMAARRARVREVLEAIDPERREAVRDAFEEFARAAGTIPETPYIEGARSPA
ncbi:MAG: MarR family transcriptional regulator [Acidimicrobiales bacterium]